MVEYGKLCFLVVLCFSSVRVIFSTSTIWTTECPPDWKEFKGSCYRGFQKDLGTSWEDAEAACQAEHVGAHLVSIHNECELDFVIGLMAYTTGILIGLKENGDFTWSDCSAYQGYPVVGQSGIPYTCWVIDNNTPPSYQDLDCTTSADQFADVYVCKLKDPCVPNPCLNCGTCEVIKYLDLCIPNEKAFKCDCQPGCSGETCETNICVPNPCHSGGTCLATPDNKVECKCHPGFFGRLCQNRCPCINGGTCHGPEMNCLCPTGFYGKRCHISKKKHSKSVEKHNKQ